MTSRDVGILRGARDLLMDESAWQTRSLNNSDFNSPPTAWCAVGAVHEVRRRQGLDVEVYMTPEVKLLELTSLLRFAHTPEMVNDTLGYEAVMEMFDHAIKFAEESK